MTCWNFHLGPNPEQLEVNEVIASYLRKIGIQIELVPIDCGAFRGKYIARPQKFELPAEIGVQFPWTGPSLLGQFRVFLISHEAGGVLSTYWDRSKADRLYREMTAIIDPQGREWRLQAINRELYEEYWAVPIAMRHMPFTAGPRIADWQPTNATPTALAFETLRPK